MVSVESGISAFSKDVRTLSIDADGVACNSVSGFSPTPGCSLFSAVITYIQKRSGSLSLSSSETQARDRALRLNSAHQLLNNVVFTAQLGLAADVFELAAARGLDPAAVAQILAAGSGRSYAAEVVAGGGFNLDGLASVAGGLLAKDVRMLAEHASLTDSTLLHAADAALERMRVTRDR